MESHYKRIANKLPTLSILFILIIVLGFVFIKKPEHQYRLPIDKTLEEILKYQDGIRPEKIADIIASNDSLYCFIDLRSPEEFIKGHLPNAINIPAHKILSKEFSMVLNQDKHINILYHSDHVNACGPWLLLKQLGYKNNKIMLGGYNFAKSNLIDDYSPLSVNFKDEKAKYDFVKIKNSIQGNMDESKNTTEQKTTNTPVKKKEKKSGGGC